MTDRITADHLKRGAIVYVRQYSPEQMRHHAESTRIRVGYAKRPSPLVGTIPSSSWTSSASRLVLRPPRGRLPAHDGGGVPGSRRHHGVRFEASRLSCNSKDWAQLFEFRGHLDTRGADPDQVYDLAPPEERLILGVSVPTAAAGGDSGEGQARRGDVYPAGGGLSWTTHGQIELNPGRRVQESIRILFDKLAEFGGVRQVLMGL
jgi:hypothetical protein